MAVPHPEIALLLSLIDQGFERKAWHGPNLRGSICGLTADQAAWRPRPRRRNIAEIVAHAAYWKYAVRRKLRGDRRGSFPLRGSNWPALPEPLTDTDWRRLVVLLVEEHGTLRAAVAEFDADRLHDKPPASRYTPAVLIAGVAAHDVYHAGQVQLLKRLQQT
jgi:hypothetical protein